MGSALLVDARTGRLNRAWLQTLIEDLLRLRRRGQQVILVSSGAIALGRRQLGLPAGVTGTSGHFDSGDTVRVFGIDGLEVARGIVGYSDTETLKIMGRCSTAIAQLLGFRGHEELIHRDDLVIMRHE